MIFDHISPTCRWGWVRKKKIILVLKIIQTMGNQQFQSVKGARIKKSAFDLSHERKLSAEMGTLVPILCQECLPGDKFKIDTQSMIRLAPMVTPVMHRINSYIHFFWVPKRIIWPSFEDFITGKEDITVPTKALVGNVMVNSLADHLGIPPGNYNLQQENINILPFYAYYKIYNDYYRDQNLQDPEINFSDPSFLSDLWEKMPLVRAWEKDYFTSALPWAQKGDPVKLRAEFGYLDQSQLRQDAGLPATNDTLKVDGSLLVGGLGGEKLRIENLSTVEIDINELRYATRLQRWFERNARAGSRYVEHLLAHWGVRSSDARLQRAEYIGGGKSPVVISEVMNMTGSESEDALPVGMMAGRGLNIGRTNQASKFCEEHGYIIGIMSVMPEPAYMQGLPKMFSRLVNLDYYYPEFSQLGEQEVLEKELYLSSSDETTNNSTFGYQARYAEYKYMPSSVHGQFRTTLDHWHLARKFEETPRLNEEFIKCQPDVDRIFAVSFDKQHLWIQLYHKINAIRPMPFYNDPTL